MEKPNRQKLSIHGRDSASGRQSDRPYNSNPQENKEPTTERGRRRKAGKASTKKS